MPDIREWDMFKDDIEKDNKAFLDRINNVPEPTSGSVDLSANFGTFDSGTYVNNDKTVSVDDVFLQLSKQNNTQAIDSLSDTYITPNKDFNSGFDNFDEKKYLKGKFGMDITKSLAENEQIYFADWDKQNPITKTLKTIGTFATNVVEKAGLKFMEGIGYVGSAVNPFNYGDNYFLKVADNGFSKFFENTEEGLKDDAINRTFREMNYDDKGIFAKALTSEFWGGSAADGFAFALSAMIPLGGIASKIGKAVGVAGKTIEGASGLAKIAEEAGAAGEGISGGAGKGARLFTGTAGSISEAMFGSRAVSAPVQWAYGVATESFAESKGVVDDLRRRRALNDPTDTEIYGMSDKEFNNYMSNKAAASFGANVALLSATNLFQTRMLYKALGRAESPAIRAVINMEGKAVAKEYATTLAKFFKGTRLGKSLVAAAEGTLMEGYIEENAQLAIERINSSRQNDEFVQYNPNKDTSAWSKFWSQLAGQTWAVTTWLPDVNGLPKHNNDNELSESIFLGGLMGGGMAVGAENLQRRKYRLATDEAGNQSLQRVDYKNRDILKGWGYGEIRNEKDHATVVLADLENKYNNWQNAQSISKLKAKYNSLEEQILNETDEEKKRDLQLQLDATRKEFVSTALATTSKLKNLDEQTILSEYLEPKHPIASTVLKQQAFAAYALSANNAGLAEGLLGWLNQLTVTPDSVITELGKDPNSFDSVNHPAFVKITQAILANNKNKKFNTENFQSKNGLTTFQSLEILNQNRKDRANLHNINSIIYDDAVRQSQTKIFDNAYHSESPEINVLQDLAKRFLEFHANIHQSNQLIESDSLSKDELKNEQSRLESNKLALEKLLSTKEHDFIDYSIFDQPVNNYQEAANFIGKQLSDSFLKKGINDIIENSTLDSSLQKKQSDAYFANLIEENIKFSKKMADQLQNIYDVSAFKNASESNKFGYNKLININAEDFITYLKEQHSLSEKNDTKPEEKVLPVETHIEQNISEEFPIPVYVPVFSSEDEQSLTKAFDNIDRLIVGLSPEEAFNKAYEENLGIVLQQYTLQLPNDDPNKQYFQSVINDIGYISSNNTIPLLQSMTEDGEYTYAEVLKNYITDRNFIKYFDELGQHEQIDKLDFVPFYLKDINETADVNQPFENSIKEEIIKFLDSIAPSEQVEQTPVQETEEDPFETNQEYQDRLNELNQQEENEANNLPDDAIEEDLEYITDKYNQLREQLKNKFLNPQQFSERESLINRAIDIINSGVITNYTADVLKEAINDGNLEKYLSEISEQAHDPLSFNGTVMSYGEEITNIAMQLFPNVQDNKQEDITSSKVESGSLFDKVKDNFHDDPGLGYFTKHLASLVSDDERRADIERRRKEELNNIIQTISIEVFDNEGNIIQNTDQKININAKYDAELAALNNSKEEIISEEKINDKILNNEDLSEKESELLNDIIEEKISPVEETNDQRDIDESENEDKEFPKGYNYIDNAIDESKESLDNQIVTISGNPNVQAEDGSIKTDKYTKERMKAINEMEPDDILEIHSVNTDSKGDFIRLVQPNQKAFFDLYLYEFKPENILKLRPRNPSLSPTSKRAENINSAFEKNQDDYLKRLLTYMKKNQSSIQFKVSEITNGVLHRTGIDINSYDTNTKEKELHPLDQKTKDNIKDVKIGKNGEIFIEFNTSGRQILIDFKKPALKDLKSGSIDLGNILSSLVKKATTKITLESNDTGITKEEADILSSFIRMDKYMLIKNAYGNYYLYDRQVVSAQRNTARKNGTSDVFNVSLIIGTALIANNAIQNEIINGEYNVSKKALHSTLKIGDEYINYIDMVKDNISTSVIFDNGLPQLINRRIIVSPEINNIPVTHNMVLEDTYVIPSSPEKETTSAPKVKQEPAVEKYTKSAFANKIIKQSYEALNQLSDRTEMETRLTDLINKYNKESDKGKLNELNRKLSELKVQILNKVDEETLSNEKNCN